ncbi:MAG: hypothetical protein II837_09615, partial [Treponema sp.]|nr:hypothetical protein [Treponema sp.]
APETQYRVILKRDKGNGRKHPGAGCCPLIDNEKVSIGGNCREKRLLVALTSPRFAVYCAHGTLSAEVFP